ncbi:MAG TPA: aldo/keto reductase [Candidatus Limnocylindrales bacterium]|nr:aldo/keto reductase [Candidatus Limnocylindrales bacterium]
MATTVRLGDLELARVGLGTNRLMNTRDNIALVKAAVAAGVQMIDTAHSYTGGDSEETIGTALSPFPEGIVVATKGGIGGPGRGRPEVLRAEIEESFRRLRTDTIPLYYLHRVDPQTPIEESVAAIKEYQDRGRIRQIGISEVGIEQIERARKVAPIAAVQNQYNIEERKYDPVVDYCTAEGIVFVPFFPLRARGGPAVAQIAQRHRATPHQVLLAWLLQRSPLMLPIPGTLSLEHLKQNVGALAIELSDSELKSLS